MSAKSGALRWMKSDVLTILCGPVSFRNRRRRLRVLDAAPRARRAAHYMRAVHNPRLFEPRNLFARLFGIVVLLDKGEHVVQPALDSDVELAHAVHVQRAQLFGTLRRDVRHSRVHAHVATVREIFMDKRENFKQPLRAQAERVAVAEEDFLRAAAEILHAQQLRLHLVERQLAEFQMLEQCAEAAGVIGAADRDRQHEPAYLHRRLAYLSFVIHRLSPPSLSLYCSGTRLRPPAPRDKNFEKFHKKRRPPNPRAAPRAFGSRRRFAAGGNFTPCKPICARPRTSRSLSRRASPPHSRRSL